MADFGENPDQGKFWNEASGLSWVENDRLMSERLETISQLLLENLDLHPSSKILDIGCGGGTTTLALAKGAPPSVQITGLDISKPLLDLAAQKCAEHKNINFVLADAQAHRFAVQKLDTVISRFGVMFFENPVKAFQNIKSALRVAGRLRFVCWAPLEENEFFTRHCKPCCNIQISLSSPQVARLGLWRSAMLLICAACLKRPVFSRLRSQKHPQK